MTGGCTLGSVSGGMLNPAVSAGASGLWTSSTLHIQTCNTLFPCRGWSRHAQLVPRAERAGELRDCDCDRARAFAQLAQHAYGEISQSQDS